MTATPAPTLVVIAGPTASGKTAAAINLAQHYGTVVVSADSRQFFREMSIGTAKPDAGELAEAKHYFIDSHSINEPLSVGDYEREGLQLLETLFHEHNIVIMAGGSGLYIKAICEGFDDLPTAGPGIREALNAQLEAEGIEALQTRLKSVDPVYYSEVDLNNSRRLIRALEVYESTGQPFSGYRKSKLTKRSFNIIKIGMNMNREVLYERINRRVDLMMDLGLLDEVRSLMPHRNRNALNTVGYAELFDYLDGNTDLETAVSLIKQNTRRFAKRQMTWFRKDGDINWVDAASPELLNDMTAVIDARI